ncbi:hypothetical protein BGZ79_006080 [Entomortierella chlamydospora]|nr:hypothetical protein BGZ79_006080 [Entomortierella chlamydospora]
MSLPRFLRGFQKKSPASNSDNGPPLSRRNSTSSSSSNSSEPTDAFGFPLPVTTVITTIQLHPATPTSPISPPLYLGPMNNLFEENSVTSPLISSDSVLGIENERMDNCSSSSSKGSCNSGHQLNYPLDPHINNEKHSRPSSPSSFRSSIYPTPQKEESVLDSVYLSRSAPSTSLHLSVSDSTPALVQAVNETLPDESSKTSTIKTIGFDIILTVTEVNEDGELEENLLMNTATGANIEESVGGSNTGSTKHDLVVNDGEQQQLQGRHNSDESDQPAASDTGAVPAIPNEGVTTMDQDQPVVALTVPLLVTSIESVDLKPDTNSIHPLNSIQEHGSSRRYTLESKRRSRSLSTPTRSRSLSSPNNNATRPVSILKNGSPKSTLRSRSRSGSQPMTSVLAEESDSHDSLIPAFPSPPSTTSSQRLSVCSSSSLASRTSLYLHQDSMAETSVRRAGSQSQRRSSIRDVQSVQSVERGTQQLFI